MLVFELELVFAEAVLISLSSLSLPCVCCFLKGPEAGAATSGAAKKGISGEATSTAAPAAKVVGLNLTGAETMDPLPPGLILSPAGMTGLSVPGLPTASVIVNRAAQAVALLSLVWNIKK